MADYANRNARKYIADKAIMDTILLENPVPSNIIKPLKMDEFFKQMMEESNMKNELVFHNIFEKLQKKTVSIFGPLSKAWCMLEGAMVSDDEQPVLSLEDLSKLMEQTVTFNAITYNRHLAALTIVMAEQKKAKTTLREHSDLLEEGEGNLFGRELCKHVQETAKAKKEFKEIYRPTTPKRYFPSQRKPFRKGPSFQKENGG